MLGITFFVVMTENTLIRLKSSLFSRFVTRDVIYLTHTFDLVPKIPSKFIGKPTNKHRTHMHAHALTLTQTDLSLDFSSALYNRLCTRISCRIDKKLKWFVFVLLLKVAKYWLGSKRCVRGRYQCVILLFKPNSSLLGKQNRRY